jgi:CHAD domain-containing protein
MSNHEQIEIERKYDVGGLAAVPDLAGVGPVVSSVTEEPFALRAVYFDTADHVLLANRITLRRREGGHDEGWHVKLPAGGESTSEARREVHAPLGTDADEPLPTEVRRVVEVVLRGRPVHPVLVIETERTLTLLRDAEGEQLAEVADDEVTATKPDADTPRRWREWEVELAEGISRRLGDSLLDAVGDALESAGASVSGSVSKLARGLGSLPDVSALAPAARVVLPPKSAAAFVIAAVAGLTTELKALDPEVRDPEARAGSDEPVHRFRTTVRRLRSILRVYRGVLSNDDTAWLAEELAAVGRAAGAARDLDVAAANLRSLVASAPEGYVAQQIVGRLEAGFREASRDAGRDLERALSDPAYFELLDRLDRAVSVAPDGKRADDPATAFVAARLSKETKRARALLRGASESVESDEFDRPILHNGRKAARRLRYAIEAATTAGVKGVAGHGAKTTHRIQDALGDALDTDAAAESYLSAASTARWAGEDTFGYGVLATLALAARADALGRVSGSAWRLQ